MDSNGQLNFNSSFPSSARCQANGQRESRDSSPSAELQGESGWRTVSCTSEGQSGEGPKCEVGGAFGWAIGGTG